MSIQIPRFKPSYTVRTVPHAGTFLLTEILPTVLNGALNERVCPLVDGLRSADDIVEALRGTVSPAEVYYALNVLEQRGFIEESLPEPPPAQAAFWHACGIDPTLAVERLTTTPVRVVALGSIDPAPVRDALAAAGVTVADDGPMTLVATDDYRRPEIDEIDAKAMANDERWALVKPVGFLPWIGPFFDPAVPGCWRCLVDRIHMNYAVDTFVEERTGAVAVTSVAALDAGVQGVLGLTAVELAKWIAGDGTSDLVGTLVSLSMTTFQLERHAVGHRPQCTRCGEPDYRERRTKLREPAAIPLQSQPVLQSVAGGHRTATAEETLRRYDHLVSPITGVVSRLESVSPPDHPVVHAYAANHNWATHPDSLAFLKQTLRSQSGGKGTTQVQAKVGAMAEAFERYSGVFRADEIRRRATIDELRQGRAPGTGEAVGTRVIEPNDIMLFSSSQFERRREINAEGNSFQMVPEPFDPEAAADWSPMWAPSTDSFTWVPTGLLYYSYSKLAPHDTPNRLAYYADSNGCAAGNTLEEAALQAMLELVERDAVATWWYNAVRRPAVDLDTIVDPYLDDLRQWLEQERRDLWVVDITNDVGIPVFAAISRRWDAADNGAENLVVGFGAHLDPHIGVMRAITEVNQFFASLFALGEGDLRKAFDPGAVEWWSTASVANKPYVAPLEGAPLRRADDYPKLSSHDLFDEVNTTVSMIEARGLEVLLLDQTRPDVGFPVIKAVVPGMRHFWNRVGPGRLYDVPVELGWLDAPLTEDELNPTPVFF